MSAVLLLTALLVTAHAEENIAPPQEAREGAVPGASIKVPNKDEMFRIRDPFKHPDLAFDKAESRTPLEMVPLDQFKMVGAITGSNRVRAMLLDSAGKTYFVSENMKIGLRRGVVKKILSDSILVREKIVNVLGVEEDVDTILHLSSGKAETLDANNQTSRRNPEIMGEYYEKR